MMSRFGSLFAAICMFWASLSGAQEYRALARVDVLQSSIEAHRSSVDMTLSITQAVPWAVRLAHNPPRLIVDFREIDWRGVDPAALDPSGAFEILRMGNIAPGWSRLVAVFDAPHLIESAEMRTDPSEGTAIVEIKLRQSTQAAFEAAVEVQPESPVLRPQTVAPPLEYRRQTGDRPVRVVLDPGHGGIDPGAERGGLRESEIMLTFSRELEDALLRAGGFEVVKTRDSDVFVPLLERMTIARAAKADVFVSLHADALAEGEASGATVYTLSQTASDDASDLLAQRMARDDLILGVDLSQQDDEIAGVLMDLARAEVAPRSAALADALVEGIGQAVGRLHKRPRLEAAFAVLTAPEVPSVLVEVGFMSDPRDLANLRNPAWRARAAQGMVAALQAWAVSDAAEALQLRQ